MTSASAPGKIILYGEHAVVFGQPALAMAVDLRTKVGWNPSQTSTLNGEPLDEAKWPYVGAALRTAGRGPAALTISSDIPPMSGLGSSAAVTVATLAALLGPSTVGGPGDIAKKAFQVELEVQGRASPIDTSTCTHGKAVLLDRHRRDSYLWSVSRGDTDWHVHGLDLPDLTLVLANTGVRPPTGPLVARVRERVEADRGAREAVERIGQIALEGSKALLLGDMRRAGTLMVEDHRLLAALGVSHPFLDRLVEEALGAGAYGAKLTGAGGGGSMIALGEDPPALARVLQPSATEVRVVRGSPQGVAYGTDGRG